MASKFVLLLLADYADAAMKATVFNRGEGAFLDELGLREVVAAMKATVFNRGENVDLPTAEPLVDSPQ